MCPALSDEPLNVIYGLHLGDRRYRYIGLTTVGIDVRMKYHIRDSRHRKRPVYFWMNKYGAENIKISIIEECSSFEELTVREMYWIAKYREEGFELLNMTDGGEGRSGPTFISESTRIKYSERSKGNSHALGYKHTEDAISRIGEAARGNSYAKGYQHTEDARNRISAAHKGKPHPYAERSAHTRWHTKKQISKPDTCKHCKEELTRGQSNQLE